MNKNRIKSKKQLYENSLTDDIIDIGYDIGVKSHPELILAKPLVNSLKHDIHNKNFNSTRNILSSPKEYGYQVGNEMINASPIFQNTMRNGISRFKKNDKPRSVRRDLMKDLKSGLVYQSLSKFNKSDHGRMIKDEFKSFAKENHEVIGNQLGKYMDEYGVEGGSYLGPKISKSISHGQYADLYKDPKSYMYAYKNLKKLYDLSK